MVMDDFYVDFHHGGYFVENKYVGGEMSNWKCDDDRWCCFEILGVVKEMKYPIVQEMLYDFAGTLKALEDDFGALEALHWSKTKGKVNIYIIHPIEEPDLDVSLPETQPENNVEDCMDQGVEDNVEDYEDQGVEDNMEDCGDQGVEDNIEDCHYYQGVKDNMEDCGDEAFEEIVEDCRDQASEDNVEDNMDQDEEQNLDACVEQTGDHHEEENVDHHEEENVDQSVNHHEEENMDQSMDQLEE
ncbi:unnamed protein product [Lathyrus sativus]|nr:unnamed protein product [Lathyrus sativus]